jgi:hypothetical protein
MAMTFHIKPETEARLLAKAQEQGVSIDALLEQLMNETEAPPAAANGKAPELPAWHLGTKSSLRRRDIYDDVR